MDKTLKLICVIAATVCLLGMGQTMQLPVVNTPLPVTSGPAPPAGAIAWYRGDVLTCTSGCSGTNVVTGITDKTGNGYNASGSTGATYVASGYGSQPGILFNGGSSSVFTIAGSGINLQSHALTMCAVIQLTSTSGKASLIANPNPTAFAYWFDNSGSEQGADVGGAAQLANGSHSPDTSPHSVCITFNGSNSTHLYIDGSDDLPGGSSTVATVSANETDLGANLSNEYYKGTLYDLSIWNSVLPTSGSNSIATWFTYTSSRY